MRVTVNDVARKARVSQATVSLALRHTPLARYKLSEKTVKRIRKIADAMGYRANRMALALKSGKSRIIGVLLPSLYPRGADCVTELDGILSTIRPAYNCVVSIHGRDGNEERRALWTCIDNCYEGVIAYWTGDRESVSLYRELLKHSIPLVFYGGGPDIARTFAIDFAETARKAVAALVGLGHRKILFLDHAQFRSGLVYNYREPAKNGYLRAMSEGGNARFAKVVCPEPGQAPDHRGLARFAEQALVAQILSGGRYTAVLTLGDPLGYIVINRCRQMGIAIPEQLSVMGLGDFYTSNEMMNDLSSVSEGQKEIGTLAATALLKLIRSPKEKTEFEKFTPQVYLRGSTGPAPR